MAAVSSLPFSLKSRIEGREERKNAAALAGELGALRSAKECRMKQWSWGMERREGCRVGGRWELRRRVRKSEAAGEAAGRGWEWEWEEGLRLEIVRVERARRKSEERRFEEGGVVDLDVRGGCSLWWW